MLTPTTRQSHDLAVSTSMLMHCADICTKHAIGELGKQLAQSPTMGDNDEVTISIERITVLSYHKPTTKYGIVVTQGATKHHISFASNDQTVLYVLALMRYKMGIPLYIHELSINGKGSTSTFKRQESREWFSKVYNIVYNGERKSFDTWFDSVRRKGRVLYQAKAQTTAKLRSTIDNNEVAEMCELISTNDTMGDSFYTFKCPRHNIKLSAELERLMSQF